MTPAKANKKRIMIKIRMEVHPVGEYVHWDTPFPINAKNDAWNFCALCVLFIVLMFVLLGITLNFNY